jgi:hypothetical protein
VSEFFATNAPDPLHWTQNSCFRVFRTVSLPHESQCQTGRTGGINEKVRKTKLLRHFSKRTHPIHSIGPKTHVLGCFGPFHESRVGIFHNERTRSIPLDPKLKFWGVFDHFDTAQKSMQNWPHWCHYRTSSLNKVASEVLATNAPDPLHWTPNSCFGAFHAISLLHESRCKTGRTRDIIAQVR